MLNGCEVIDTCCEEYAEHATRRVQLEKLSSVGVPVRVGSSLLLYSLVQNKSPEF